MLIHAASPFDIPALVSLLNTGYRGEISRKGWTHEADFIDGEVRTNETTIAALMNQPGAIFLKYNDEDGNLFGCVFLQIQSNRLYLGMLCVNPGLQSKGIGKQLMKAAAIYAKENGCNLIYMKVISLRIELIDWYERQGYHRTGDTEPFPKDSEFGVPIIPLEFEILEKEI